MLSPRHHRVIKTVDATASGLDLKDSAATTAALSAVTYSNGSSGVGATLLLANGALTVDGATMYALLSKDGWITEWYDTVTTWCAAFVLTNNFLIPRSNIRDFTFVETGTLTVISTISNTGTVLTLPGTGLTAYRETSLRRDSRFAIAMGVALG